jgi:dTDP-L-rhamnose 4-epimerase
MSAAPLSGRKGDVLVTGGAGFIGSHLVDTLLDRGFGVTVLDNLSPQVHGDADLDDDGWPLYLNPKARRFKGDILHKGVFAEALEGATHLIHLAASVGVGQSMSNIVDYTENNTLAAAIILETLSNQKHHVRRMAVASSMSIYGEGEYERPSTGHKITPEPRTLDQLRARQWEMSLDGEALEPIPTPETKPLQPASVYAINKRDHEEMFLVVGRSLGIPTVALRLFNAYGSRQALSNPYTGVAAIFISRLLNDEPPMIFEDGRQTRDFVHVSDVANAFAAALDSDLEIWDAFNVGSGHAISVAEMAKVLARLLKKDINPEILNRYRVGDIRHCVADISKLDRVLGVKPKTSFDEGMKELISWVSSARKPVNRSSESLAQLVEGALVI